MSYQQKVHREYLGDYDYYVEKKNEMIERAELEQEDETPVQKTVAQEKLNYLEEKERKSWSVNVLEKLRN